MSIPFLALRLDHILFLVDHREAARAVAEVLMRPCFGAFTRVSALQNDHPVGQTEVSRQTITECLVNPAFQGIMLDSGRLGNLTAVAVFPNGQYARHWAPSPARLRASVVVPLAGPAAPALVQAACDLALILDARFGAITVEPTHSLAERWVLGGRPKPRPGLSARRRVERRAYCIRTGHTATEISGPEWGLFLGAGHLARLDLQAVCRSGAFEKVEAVARNLVFLQLTAHPEDDLSDSFESRLNLAREALAPVLMDLSVVPLE